MRNWTIKDAVAVIQNGKDTEAIREIAKHFPVFFMAVAKNDLGAVAAMMTDKMTVRRLQMEAAEGEEDSDEDVNDEVEDVEAEATSDADASDDGEDLESMSTKQLIALCGKRGIKVPKYGKNKKFYLDALQGGAKETDADDNTEDDAEDDDPYAGKNAIQLYSLCKKRDLKVKPKQKAAVYLEALKAADAEASDAEDDADDDWDDEVEEEKPAKKSTKKAPVKKSAPKKAAKKAEPEEDEDGGDDDDDWEI